MGIKKLKFCTRSRKVRFLFFLHSLLRTFRKKHTPLPPEKVNSILICNWANLGDVLLATSIIPALKEKWPQAKIGFLTSPTSKIVLQDHPLIDTVHIASNWKQRVLNASFFRRFLTFLHICISSNTLFIEEIKNQYYDLAIDTHPFFPNCSYILRKARIPYFLEFSSAGLHLPQTCAIDFPKKLEYLPKMYCSLLQALNIAPQPLNPCFHFTHTSPLKGQEYIVLHMGTTEVRREWSTGHWITLARTLAQEGKTIVFTGQGKREAKAIQEVTSFLPHFINLCDQLNWSEFISVIKDAKTLISVNTVSVHLAAYLGTPCIALYFATYHPELWMPDYGSIHFLIEENSHVYLSDASFFKQRKNITQVAKITPQDVYLKSLSYLSVNGGIWV
ncbi:MAG: glycosyltransferase family 9 protein [Rhabdochlamydiaceae bacterium]|jgi:ADP-heptose:LPS heptosyltransferase